MPSSLHTPNFHFHAHARRSRGAPRGYGGWSYAPPPTYSPEDILGGYSGRSYAPPHTLCSAWEFRSHAPDSQRHIGRSSAPPMSLSRGMLTQVAPDVMPRPGLAVRASRVKSRTARRDGLGSAHERPRASTDVCLACVLGCFGFVPGFGLMWRCGGRSLLEPKPQIGAPSYHKSKGGLSHGAWATTGPFVQAGRNVLITPTDRQLR